MKKPKKKKKPPGCGIGPHAEVSPMGHATRTRTLRETRDKRDKRENLSARLCTSD
jgi:hypothetical protein